MTSFFWILLLVVTVLLFGGAVIGFGLWLLWYAIIGLVIGGLARLLVSGTSGLGVVPTIAAGIIGSFGGGAIASRLDLSGLLSLVVSVLVAAIAVAMLNAGSAGSRD